MQAGRWSWKGAEQSVAWDDIIILINAIICPKNNELRTQPGQNTPDRSNGCMRCVVGPTGPPLPKFKTVLLDVAQVFIWASRGHARPAGARGAVRGERRGRQRAGVGREAGTRGGRGAGRVLRRVQEAHAVTHLRASVRPAAVPAAASPLHGVSALDARLALSVVARAVVAAVAAAVPAAAAVAAAAAVPAVVLLRHLNAQHGRRRRPAGFAAACGAEVGVGR